MKCTVQYFFQFRQKIELCKPVNFDIFVTLDKNYAHMAKLKIKCEKVSRKKTVFFVARRCFLLMNCTVVVKKMLLLKTILCTFNLLEMHLKPLVNPFLATDNKMGKKPMPDKSYFNYLESICL